jgi:hypothetical protein
MSRQRRCRICHKRPPWRYQNCPPGICKRCYHARVWPDRPAARRERRAAEGATTSYPLADFPNRLLDDDDDVDCLGACWSADAATLDPLDPDVDRDLDLEAIAAWEQDPGGRWDADHEQTASPEPAGPEPRAAASEHPRCRLCRKVRHRYAQTADGLLRVCLGCAQGLPLARLTASEAGG